MFVQNFGWPDGRLGGLGPAGSTTPEHVKELHTNARHDYIA